jgi:hypothetical protein
VSSIADMLNGITDIINGKRTENTPAASPIPKIPDQLIGAPGVLQAPVLGTEWARQASAQLPQIVEQVSAAPTTIYNLLNAGAKWAFGSESDVLPGAEGSRQIDESIRQTGGNVAEWMLDEPRNTNLLSGTPPELAANWAGLATTAIARAPAMITSKVDEGIKLLEAGKGLAARTGEYAAKALETITPVMVRTPTKGIEAASVGIAGALGAGFEMAFPDPNVKEIDEARKQGTTTAITGAETAAPDVDAMQKQANPLKAAFSTGNDWLDGAIVAAGIAGGLAYYKRDSMKRVLGAMGKGEETVLGQAETLRTQVVDRTTPVKSAYGTIHPSYKERFATAVDESQGAAIDTKLKSVFDYGEIPGSAVKLPPVRDLYTVMGKAGPDAVEIAERAIVSRREYFDDAARQVRSVADRTNDWNLAQANPAVKGIIDQYDTTVKKMLDYAVEQRYISPARRTQIINESLHQFPKDLGSSGLNLGSLKRSIKTDDFAMGQPLRDLPGFIEQTIRNVEWNKIQRTLVNELRSEAAAGNQYAQSIIGRGGVNKRTVKDAVMFRDFNGNVDSQEVLDPLIKRALGSGDNISRLHQLSGVMAKMARLFEQSATGKIATITGQPFAHIAALYNAGIGSALRPRGVAVGYFDKGLQSMGFKFGLPGDPTLVADAAIRAAQGVRAVTIKRAADFLHNSVVRDGVFANALGPQNADKMATALTNQYKRTWVHAFQQEGLLGPASVGGINPDQAIKHAIGVMQTANVPVRAMRETLKFVDDILHAISSSPTASVWALNSNLPRDLRARAVREFTGDPSRSGAFAGLNKNSPQEVAGRIAAATPWGNIYLQSMDKFARSFSTREKAFSSLTGMTVAVGLPTISAALWNASLGKEYSDYQYNRRTPDRQSSSVYVGLPGASPQSGLEIPVDPLMRPYKLGMELLAGSHLGLLDGSLFFPENGELRAAFTEMARNRWYGAGEGTVGASMLEQSVMPPTPTALNAVLASQGVNLRSYIDTNEIHSRTDSGYTSSDAKNPFRQVLGLKESAVAESVMRALGANAGAMAFNMFMDSAQRINEDAPVAKNLKQQLKLGASDSARQVSGLFGSFASVSPSQEAAGKLVQEKTKGLQQLAKSLQAITSNGALDGGEIVGSKQRGYQALLGGRLAVEPNDPRMLEVSAYAQQQLRLISEQFLGANKDDYQQRSSLQASTQYSPERKRAMMNELAGQITQRNRQLLVLLQQFEAQVGAKLGTPNLRLEKLNINKGLEQFED